MDWLHEKGMEVSKCWFPDLVLGSGPTQSTITLLKDSAEAGMGWRGDTGKHFIRSPHNFAGVTRSAALGYVSSNVCPIEMGQYHAMDFVNPYVFSHSRIIG